MKSKDLRTHGNCCGKLTAKILRLRATPSAQDDIFLDCALNEDDKTGGGAMRCTAQNDKTGDFSARSG